MAPFNVIAWTMPLFLALDLASFRFFSAWDRTSFISIRHRNYNLLFLCFFCFCFCFDCLLAMLRSISTQISIGIWENGVRQRKIEIVYLKLVWFSCRSLLLFVFFCFASIICLTFKSQVKWNRQSDLNRWFKRNVILESIFAIKFNFDDAMLIRDLIRCRQWWPASLLLHIIFVTIFGNNQSRISVRWIDSIAWQNCQKF